MDSTTAIGVLGAALLLIAFVASALKKIRQTSLVYSGLNLAGASLLSWYAVLLGSVPFFVLEGIWALVALFGVLKRLAPKR